MSNTFTSPARTDDMVSIVVFFFLFFSSRRRHTRCLSDWSSDVCSSDLGMYRMQVYDERTAGMHWQRQKVAAEHYRDHIRTQAMKLGAPSFASFAKGGNAAAVDIMARSSGGAMQAAGDRPSGKMEVAVAIGTEPALTFSAIVPAPPDVEEFIIAGFLRQKPVE